jgi:hypothetical protein
MKEPSSSPERAPEVPDLTFPVLEPVPARQVPASAAALAQILELSEALLPLVTKLPDFEARRLALKVRVPFRLL